MLPPTSAPTLQSIRGEADSVDSDSEERGSLKENERSGTLPSSERQAASKQADSGGGITSHAPSSLSSFFPLSPDAVKLSIPASAPSQLSNPFLVALRQENDVLTQKNNKLKSVLRRVQNNDLQLETLKKEVAELRSEVRWKLVIFFRGDHFFSSRFLRTSAFVS